MCKKKKTARTRIRTEDLIITSDALYQLSHTSFWLDFACNKSQDAGRVIAAFTEYTMP